MGDVNGGKKEEEGEEEEKELADVRPERRPRRRLTNGPINWHSIEIDKVFFLDIFFVLLLLSTSSSSTRARAPMKRASRRRNLAPAAGTAGHGWSPWQRGQESSRKKKKNVDDWNMIGYSLKTASRPDERRNQRPAPSLAASSPLTAEPIRVVGFCSVILFFSLSLHLVRV